MEAEITIVTFRDIFQYEAGKKGRFTDEYRDLSAQIFLDKQDMARLGVKDGQRVSVQNGVGMVVVVAKTSDDDPHPGLAFMTNSPWANQLVGDDLCETSIPGFKRIAARVSPAEESITSVFDILQRMRAEG
jgi:formylmethanofuran dehydrogenase subunit D